MDFDTQTDAPKDSLEYAWKWFELHALQRMQSINFYLIVAVALGGGYATAFQAKLYFISVAAGLLLLAFTILFYFLECRTKQLVKLGEAALFPLEQKLSNSVGDGILLAKRSAEAAHHAVTYGKVFHTMFWIVGATSCFAVLVALLASANP